MSQWHCSPGFQLVVPFWMSDREILFTYNMLLEDWKIFSRPSVDATACYQFDQLQHPLISLEINLIDKLYSQTPSSALSHFVKTFRISLYFIVTRSYFVISFLLLLWHYFYLSPPFLWHHDISNLLCWLHVSIKHHPTGCYGLISYLKHFLSIACITLHYCQAQVQSQIQVPNPGPKSKSKIQNPKSRGKGLGLGLTL